MKEKDILKSFKDVERLLALQQSNEALTVLHKIQDKLTDQHKWFLGKSYFWESLCYKHLGDSKSAEIVASKGISIFRELGDFVEVSKMQRDLGLAYEYVGKLDKSLKALTESIETLREKDVLDAAGITFSKMGQIYLKKKDIDNALYYCDLGYRVCAEGKNSFFLLTSLLPLSLVYYYLDDTEVSLMYLKQAREILKNANIRNKFQNERRLSEILLRESLCYAKEKKVEKAFKCFKEFAKLSLITPIEERSYFTKSGELAYLMVSFVDGGLSVPLVDYLVIDLGIDIETFQEEVGIKLKK